MTGYGLALGIAVAATSLDRVRALEAYLASEARYWAEQMYVTGSYDPQAAGQWSAYAAARAGLGAGLGDALRGTP